LDSIQHRYNPNWSCALTPFENRHKVPIRAGEKDFPDERAALFRLAHDGAARTCARYLALERFARREPLSRLHECVFGCWPWIAGRWIRV
jgi:hypothetical protein